jgi:hypothetical protein
MWYALIGDDQIGPLAPAGMADLRRDGRLDESTYVWREGMADWLPLAQVPELLNAMGPVAPDDPEELDDSELRAEEEGATLMMDGEQGKDWASYLDALARQSTPLAAAVSAPLRGPGSVAHATGEQRAVQVAAAKAEAPAPLPEPAPALADFDLPSIEEAIEPAPPAPRAGPAPRASAPAPAPAPAPKGRAVEIDFGNMLEPDAEDAGTPAPMPVTLASQAPAAASAGGSRMKVWLILLPLLGATAAAVVLWVRHAQQSHGPGTPPPIASDAPTPATTAPTEPPTQAPTAAPTAAPSIASAAPTDAAAPPSVASAPPSVAVAVVSGAPKPPPSAASAAPPPASKPPAPRTAGPAPATAAPPPAPKTAAPAGGDAATKTLSRNDIMGVVDANRAGIQACGAQQPDLKGTLSVATTIERDGSVSAAQVTTSRFRGSPVGTCIEQKIKALKFPKFGADPIRFNLPLNL